MSFTKATPMTTTTMNPAEASARKPQNPTTLDALARLSSPELDALYRASGVGKGVSTLVGRPKGRMLAVRGTDGTPLFGFIERLAARAFFPWDGKTFGALGADEGRGDNRVKAIVTMLDLFDFRTRVEPSVVDGKPCVYLDYEQPGNPWFIAKIRDEIREVSPGLWLGPAMWKTGPREAAHVLWFAVDFNRPS
jgi:hypothetical protein